MSESTAALSQTVNSRQVGGRHYKTGGLEHWDLMHPAYLLGCASKYVSRHAQKGGRQDLEKAIHYCEKYAERISAGSTLQQEWRVSDVELLDWAAKASMEAADLRILHWMLHLQSMPYTITLIKERIEQRYETHKDAFLVSGMKVITPDDVLDLMHKPGTPEDGGHHARQPPDEEEIQRWDEGSMMADTLPESLSLHEWQHRCSADVQACYEFDVSSSRYLIKKDVIGFTANGRKD